MFEVVKRKLSLKVSIVLSLITLPLMFMAAYTITTREVHHLEDLSIEKGTLVAKTGAKMFAQVLEAEIDNGILTLSDVFEPVYEEIKGYDFGEHPRYHTKYDFYTDRAALVFQDAFLEASSDLLYAVGTDLNGYVPTHNSNRSLPLVGDRAKDTANYRSKRKFANPTEIAASRNTKPVIVQSYARDTGEMAWDIAVPIYIKGHHFGGFRVGVSKASIAAHQHELMMRLLSVFGGLGVVTVGFIFFMLRRSMRPLVKLSDLADEISIGEGLENPIRPTTTDEVGQMATSLNRLRASLQVALSRLAE
jgi:HAMP domain-containing protein